MHSSVSPTIYSSSHYEPPRRSLRWPWPWPISTLNSREARTRNYITRYTYEYEYVVRTVRTVRWRVECGHIVGWARRGSSVSPTVGREIESRSPTRVGHPLSAHPTLSSPTVRPPAFPVLAGRRGRGCTIVTSAYAAFPPSSVFSPLIDLFRLAFLFVG